MATTAHRPLLVALLTFALSSWSAVEVVSQPVIPQEDPALPSLAPFANSRFWDVFRDAASGDVDLGVLVEQIQTIYEIKISASEAAAPYGPQPIKGASSALLEHVPDPPERARWAAVPFALEALFALDQEETWDAPELERAQSAASIIKGLERTPKLAFSADDMSKNRASTRAAAEWYEQQLEVPEHYASMIFIDDDGPYVGLEIKSKKKLSPVASVDLGDDLVLNLVQEKKGKEPFVLQCLRGKKVLWTRRISDSPYQTVTSVRFRSEPSTKLDGLGWKVHMSVEWKEGAEYAHLYLDASGGFICYFMSW